MTDELLKKLADAGIPRGSWEKTKTQAIRSPLIESQKGLLLQLEKILEAQVEKDKAQVAELLTDLEKLKHGGAA